MEQTATLAQPEQNRELGLKPTLIKDITLISSGTWTGMDNKPTNFSAETILKGFQNTDWENMNLFLDHQDQRSRGVSNWAGFVRNVRMLGNDLVGDLEVWHPMIGMFIKEAKAKFGVSMTTEGVERMMAGDVYDYDINRFVSFSIVDDPACRVSLIDKVLSSNKETKTFISSSIEAKELANSKEKIVLKEDTHSKYNQKEVKKMENEKDQKEEAVEEKVEAKEEKVEEKVEEKELKESTESKDVKVLGEKVDGLSSDMKEMKAMLKGLSEKKELRAKEPEAEEVEEPAEEVKEAEESKETEAEETESDKELAATKEKLANAEKELATLKEDDSPDRKSLSIGGNKSVDDVNSTNMGMIGFLRENANLNY